jgi:hypothetical protein
MSWGRESLFTNVTWLPRATVSVFGVTPPDVIETVVPGVGVGEGEVSAFLPQARAAAAIAAAPANPQTACLRIRRISARY